MLGPRTGERRARWPGWTSTEWASSTRSRGRGRRSCCCTASPTPDGSGGTRCRRSPPPGSGRSCPTCAASGARTSPRPSRPTRSRTWPGTCSASSTTSASRKAHVVGHDWGAALAWALAALRARPGGPPGRAVGRPPGDVPPHAVAQREKSWYMLLFQFPGVAEQWLTEDDWANFRAWAGHPDADQVIAELEATGALTAGPELVPGQRRRRSRGRRRRWSCRRCRRRRWASGAAATSRSPRRR